MRNAFITYFSPLYIIKTIGLWWVLAVCFAENFFPLMSILPGDSLMLLLGFAAAQGKIITTSIFVIMISLWLAGVLWSIAWYILGKKLKDSIDPSKKQRRYNPSIMIKTQEYFEKYGKYAIIFSKFTPYIRSFIPLIAGMIGYPFRSFLISIMSGMWLWIGTFVGGSYYLSLHVPGASKHLDLISFFMMILALLFILYHALVFVLKDKDVTK